MSQVKYHPALSNFYESAFIPAASQASSSQDYESKTNICKKDKYLCLSFMKDGCDCVQVTWTISCLLASQKPLADLCWKQIAELGELMVKNIYI